MKTIIVRIEECKITDEQLFNVKGFKSVIADCINGDDVWVIKTDDPGELIAALY